VRVYWVLTLLGLVALCALALAFANAPQFRVRAVDATVPNGPVTRAAVLSAAAVAPDANLWLLNTAAIRQRVEAIPYVAGAAVHRAQWPQPHVELAITLRQPAGCVRWANAAVTIDTTARVLQTGCVDAALPQIQVDDRGAAAPGTALAGADVLGLLADAQTIAAQVPVRLVRRDRFGGLEAIERPSTARACC
jgi:cell division septal protein FtsQ